MITPNKKMLKTGIAGILAASLELTKEGKIEILQEKIFDKIIEILKAH